MRHLRFSTCLVIGLAVVLALVPGSRASAQGLGLDAEFSFWPTTAVVGQTVEFFDESRGGPIFWSWDFDDGGTSAQQHPTHTFVKAGNYEVHLTVYNVSDDSDEKRNIDVVALQEPNANFTYSPASPEAGQAVNFTDTSTGLPTSWFWDFDDSLDSTAQNPMHTFFVAGDYDVELTVSNLGGLDSRIVKVTVFEDVQSPEASFFFLPANPTVGQFVNFFDTSGGGPVDSWEWDFDDGDTSSEQYPGHQFASEGAYDVSLTVTNSAGETSTQQTVNVGAEIPPIDPDFDEIYFVPSASHSAGAMGSFWVTDMDVNNAGNDTANYKLAWLPRRADNSSPTLSEEFTLEPGEAVRFEDVVLSVFDIDDASGALAVVSDSDDLFIFSRTYNDTDVGTFGTALPGVAEDDLVQGDIRKRLLFFTEDSDFRSNIAFQNGTGSNLRVKWERYLADGTMVESGTTDLLPYSNKQLNAIYESDAPVEAAYMDVWTDDAGGKFMVFSSVVDNGTSDGTIVQPQW